MDKFKEESDKFINNIFDALNKNRQYLLSIDIVEDSVNRMRIPVQEFYSMPADRLIDILYDDIMSNLKRLDNFIESKKYYILNYLDLLGVKNVIYTRVEMPIPYINICFNDGINNQKLLDNITNYLVPTSDNALVLNLLPFNTENTIRFIFDLIFKSN